MFEMMFYGVITLLFITKYQRFTLQFTVMLCLSAIVVEGILPLAMEVQIASGILSFLAIMFLGTVFYRMTTGGIALQHRIGIVALGVVMIMLTTLPELILHDHTEAMAARLTAYVIFIGTLLIRHRHIPQLLVYLGTISYSLYLMQLYVHPLTLGIVWLDVLIRLGLVIGIAHCTYHLIEKPGIELGKRWSQPKSATNPLPNSDHPHHI